MRTAWAVKAPETLSKSHLAGVSFWSRDAGGNAIENVEPHGP